MEFDVESKIGYDVEVGVEVYLDLLVSDITLWEHKWKPDDLKGEYVFNWFDGTLKVPLKFGDNNSISTEDVSGGLKKEIGNHAKDQQTYMDGVNKGVNDKGPNPQEVEQQMTDKIKSEIGLAYRGAHSKEVFAFNSSINEDYFNKRIGAWNKVGRLKSLKPEVKELLKSEIRKYEREEFDAFSIYLKGETGFDAGSKFLLIDDFMRFRPSLTLEDRSSLESLIPPDQKPKKPVPAKKKPVQKKKFRVNTGMRYLMNLQTGCRKPKLPGSPCLRIPARKWVRNSVPIFHRYGCITMTKRLPSRAEVNAQAFTHENHIFFNAGKYEPGSAEGKNCSPTNLHMYYSRAMVKTLRESRKKMLPEHASQATIFLIRVMTDSIVVFSIPLKNL